MAKKSIKDLKNEVWKIIKLPSQHNSKRYYVSTRARVKSIDKTTKAEHLISLKPDHHGHLRMSLKLKDGKNLPIWVHKELAKHFVDRPSKKHTLIVHKNFKRDDNKLSNLKWVTADEHKEYIKKRLKAMGHVYHSKGGKPKLKANQVAMIKKMLAKGNATKTKIANKYKVSITQIKRIETGENWKDVKAAK